MDIEQRNSDRFSEDLRRRGVSFIPQLSTLFEVTLFKGIITALPTKITLNDGGLADWIATPPPMHNGQAPTSRLRIIRSVGPRVSDDPRNALFTIPFSQATFSIIMDQCHLPKTLLRTIFRGDAYFSGVLQGAGAENAGWKVCVMRMARDLPDPKDMAIALSWNLNTGTTYGLLLGCSEKDVKSIESFLRYSTAAVGHPLLLLALFSDLQFHRLKVLRDEALGNVEIAIQEAGLGRKQGREVLAVRRKASGTRPSVDYDKVTRDVLRNFHDSGYLLQAIIRFREQIVKVATHLDVSEAFLNTEREQYLAIKGALIANQMDSTISQYDNLIEKGRLTTNQSSLLMSAIWNLIAQKDNKINQDIARESKNIAEESKRIADESKSLAKSSAKLAADTKEIAEDSRTVAEATKRDSTSMKAIATLTMFFLPPTYVATLLAIPMFNWQPKPGETVLRFHYFRIYLAVALPLLAVVLSIWVCWLLWSMHKQKQEKERLKKERELAKAVT